MKFLRSLLRIIQEHRVLSALVLTLLVSATLIFRSIRTRSEGILSEPLVKTTLIEAVYGIGTVTANRSYQIKPGIISTINEFYVKEGDEVEKDHKLARRDQVLFRAPFTGTVTALPFKVGENVFAQAPILTLVDLSDRYLVVSLEQQGALRIKRGQKVKMSFDTLREQTYEGTVQAVYSNDNNFLARIDLGTLPENILPGMTCDVAITIEERPSVLSVPVAALEEGKFVWVKRKGSIPKRIEIKTGIIDRATAQVLSGELKDSDRVLIKKRMSR